MARRKPVDKKPTDRYSGRQMFHDTMAKLERVAKKLHIRQSHGIREVDDPLAVIAFWNGTQWDEVYGDYENGISTDREFYDQAFLLVTRFADAHNLPRPELEVA